MPLNRVAFCFDVYELLLTHNQGKTAKHRPEALHLNLAAMLDSELTIFTMINIKPCSISGEQY